MKSRLFIMCSLLLAGCAVTSPPPEFTKPGLALPPERVSPNSKLSLRLRVDPKHSRYELSDHATGKLLASGESAIVSGDFFDGRFRGTDDVTFATDGSGIVVTEDLSDAGPILRYILFHQQPDGHFAVSYLSPPTIFDPKCPAPAFSYEHPYATQLTADHITFYYLGAHKTKVLPLSDVATTPTLEPQ